MLAQYNDSKLDNNSNQKDDGGDGNDTDKENGDRENGAWNTRKRDAGTDIWKKYWCRQNQGKSR